jgi:hypothetical protein
MSNSMTLKQIDEALAAWNGRLAAVADNLLWLQNDSTYQMLTGSGGAAVLRVSGATAVRVEAALGAVPTIFEHFNILHGNIESAAQIRKDLPTIFGAEAKLAEIEHLLRGKSIQLPTQASSAVQRSLLSGAKTGEYLTPEAVLEPMVRAFDAARDAIIAVERAWTELSEGVDRVEVRLRSMEPLAAEVGGGFASEVERVRALLRSVREQIATDPLGALAALNSRVQPEVDRLSAAAEAAETTRQGLLHAHVQIDQLVALHREALAVEAEAALKVAGFKLPHGPVSEGRIERLREWLEQLERRRGEGASANVGAGLGAWKKSFEECLAQERTACAAGRAALETRRELRGRMEALKAKARARSVAELPGLAAIAREAEELLAARPTILEKAEAAVALYAKTLNAARKEAL